MVNASPPMALSLQRWRWGGVGFGVVLAVTTLALGELGRGPLLAAIAFGLGVLAGIVVGESLVRAPRGSLRRASLQPRSIRAYLPRVPTMLVVTATALLIVLMIVTTAAGSADDLDRAGRSLNYADTTQSATSGPWPGSYYTVPAAIVLVIAAIVVILTLVKIARRPAAESADADLAQRRSSADSVVAAWGVTVGVPLIGFSLTAAGALLGIGLAPGWWRVAGWALLALVIAGLALVTWCLAGLLTVPNRNPAAR